MLCMPTHGLYISLSYRQRINLQVNTTTDDSTTCTVLLSTNYCKLIQEGQSYPRKQISRKKSKFFFVIFHSTRFQQFCPPISYWRSCLYYMFILSVDILMSTSFVNSPSDSPEKKVWYYLWAMILYNVLGKVCVANTNTGTDYVLEAWILVQTMCCKH